MNKKIRAVLCLCTVISVFSGCAAQDAVSSEITVIDAGGHSLSSGEEFVQETEPSQELTLPENTSPPPHSTQTVTGEQENAAVSEEASEERGEALPEEQGDYTETSAVPTENPQPEKPDCTTVKTEAKPAETTSNPKETTPSPEKTTAEIKVEEPPEKTTSSAETKEQEQEPEDIPTPVYGSSSYTALNYSQVKGVWISYIELAEMLTGQSESGFRSAIGKAYDNCVSLGLNTVYVHVRSHSDAYYKSELFPWSKYCTGTLGKAPDFDPLEVMIEEAHSRGLSFQAWINPLRACGTGEISAHSGYKTGAWANSADTKGKYIVAVNGTYYLNPAYTEVTDYIACGAAEIVSRYDVDGLHIDDYFYPTTDSSFDSSAYSASVYSSLSDFRFANCDRLVSSLYSAVKSANPTALFGVSCQGSMENNYNQMYADVKKWCGGSGYVDYIMPQIYYGFDNSSQPYLTCAAQWNETAASGGIPLIVGLSASKIGLEDTWAGAGKYEWINGENILARQLSGAEALSSYGGVCLYSYRSVFTPESGVKAQTEKEIAAFKAELND